MGIVSKPMPLPVLPMRWANGASIACFHSQYSRWRSPWPTRKATLCADAKRTEPSPSRLPRMSLSWSSLSAYCLVATRTSSPSSISHAWRSPSGVKMTWLGVQANLRLPEPPPASTSNRSHSSVSPLSYHSTTGRGAISPVAGSIDMTSIGMR